MTVLCAAWAAFEFINGQAFWGMLAGAAAAFSVWNFFIVWDSHVKDRAKSPAANDGG